MKFTTARILSSLINTNETIQAMTNSVELTTMNSETKSVTNSSTRRFNHEKEMTSSDTFPTETVLISLLALTILIIIISASIYFLKRKSSNETKLSSSQPITNTQPCFAITIPGFS